MQVGHFCLRHQSYTMQARVRRSLAVSLLLISVFSKDTANNLCLQRERHRHEESHCVHCVLTVRLNRIVYADCEH